jgi:hypothetical protein
MRKQVHTPLTLLACLLLLLLPPLLPLPLPLLLLLLPPTRQLILMSWLACWSSAWP